MPGKVNASISFLTIHEVTEQQQGRQGASSIPYIFLTPPLHFLPFTFQTFVPPTQLPTKSNIAKMPYPESATGFMINDQKKWTEFEKKEVCGFIRKMR